MADVGVAGAAAGAGAGVILVLPARQGGHHRLPVARHQDRVHYGVRHTVEDGEEHTCKKKGEICRTIPIRKKNKCNQVNESSTVKERHKK